MKVLIHQSICGEVNKAWGLIKTTLADVSLAKGIAFKTDLQDQTSGINWNPAIRGFSEGDFFLIMRTFEDTSSDVRRGRKFSHVLIIPKKEISVIDDIAQIVSLLPKEIDKDSPLESILLELKSGYTDNTPAEMQGRFNRLIHGYIHVNDYKNTLIWMGQENFDITVIELWKRLTANERQDFKFGIAFNNDHKGTYGISLIAVPGSVQSKFVKSGFFIVAENDTHQPTELIEQLLIGDASVQQRISNFEKAIESKSLSRSDISYIAKGIDTFERIDLTQDLKKVNTLSHIVAQYAPSDKQGVKFKAKLLHKLSLLASSVNFSELSVLRNFKTDSFKNSKKDLSLTLSQWMDKNIFSLIKDQTSYALFFEQVKASNLNWWDKVITKRLETYLGTVQGTKTSVVYRWLTESPAVLSKIEAFIDKSKESEGCFVEKLPHKIPVELIAELEKFSISNSWLRLYAHLLNKQFDLREALTALIKVDQDETYFEAIEIITAKKDEKQIIDYAVATGESRLIKIAGNICYKTPKQLARVDVSNINWHLIWVEAIENGHRIETGIKDPRKKIHELYDCLIDGNEFSERLIYKISLSEFANLLEYPKRFDLWNKLPVSGRENFLIKTSEALLGQLSINSTTKIPNDIVLFEHISREGIFEFLYFNRNNIKPIIPIFKKLSQLRDDHLKEYLNNYSGKINAVDATQLGKLIVTRSFYNSAKVINSKSSISNNWRFALAECYDLLDFWTKIFSPYPGSSLSASITLDEWWQNVEELIIELYPNGPSLTTIWKKAGGKESELLINTSAANVWSDILHKLQQRKIKGVTMNDLLKEVKKQYGDNEKFKMIYELRKDFINT